MKKLVIKDTLPDREIVHFADAQQTITSRFNVVFVEKNGITRTIRLPRRWWEAGMGVLRLARRALRLDKCNVFPMGDNLIIIRAGQAYLYDAASGQIQSTLKLRNCRNVLHQSLGATPDGHVYFGEYGANPERTVVPVYRSTDGGKSWKTIYEFPASSIKHVHGCYYDPYEDAIWVCTGDFAGENRILVANRDFSRLETIGDGSQKFRTCNFFFTPENVHWLMDSPLEASRHLKLSRQSRQTTELQILPGPVWYSKSLTDGYFLAGTAQEVGPGVQDGFAHLLVSKDLVTWEDLQLFAHDGWPKRYFKFGVIGFADGEQTSKRFYLFCEALSGYDGRVCQCEIVE